MKIFFEIFQIRIQLLLITVYEKFKNHNAEQNDAIDLDGYRSIGISVNTVLFVGEINLSKKYLLNIN